MSDNAPTTPYISIVLPTYNVGQYIDRCLASCVNQTFRDIEIIIVDDCGQDDSIEKAQAWANKDSRIKIIHNERNLGTLHARRVGVTSAKGRYILFLDPDDSITQNATQEIANAALAQQPDIIFYGTQAVVVTPNGIKNEIHRPPIISRSLHKSFLKAKTYNLGTPGKAYSKEILTNAFTLLAVPETERLVYAEDALLLYAAIQCANSAISIPSLLYCYQENKNSITQQRSLSDIRKHQSQICMIIERIRSLPHKNEPATHSIIKKHFINKLSFDFHMLARHHPDEHGKDLYLHSIYNAFQHRKSLKEITRLAIYIFTLGNARL